MQASYPLLTERKIVEPIWGGKRLASWLNLPDPHPERIGETWQVYETNQIVNGPMAGRTLAETTLMQGAALVGTRSMARYGADFPLLAKFIDAGESLSIQVHPDDYYAHEKESSSGFHGKTEAWHILAAENADIVYGLSKPSDRESIAAAVAEGRIEQLLRRLPVAPGDTIYVPAGTLHAINRGIVLFEIQQKSDLTYRVYDYGRLDSKTGQPRPLHLDKALDVIDYSAGRDTCTKPVFLSEGRELLVACHYFALERWVPSRPWQVQVDPGTFEIITVVGGAARLSWSDGDIELPHGTSVVIPAGLGSYNLYPAHARPPVLLRAYVPDLAAIRAELDAIGASAEEREHVLYS